MHYLVPLRSARVAAGDSRKIVVDSFFGSRVVIVMPWD